MIVDLVMILVGVVVVVGAGYSFVRPRDEDDEPATLEGGSSHLRR